MTTDEPASSQLVPLIEAAMAVADANKLDEIAGFLDMARTLATALNDLPVQDQPTKH